ncbi:MAG: HEAT repeat domain-containing protein [Pirellulales bacterium]
MNKNFSQTRFAVPLAALMLVSALAKAAENTSPSPEKERELLAVLRSDAPGGEKALACKQLAIHGSSESVAELAKLLSDEQFASWCRIALEAIPGEAADEALRRAAESLEGKLLIGAINSIGVRRDVNAVEGLAGRLNDQDAEVASAAAVALGHIGNAAATQSLRRSLAIANPRVRSAVAEGCVLCAEKLLAAGEGSTATEIYDQIRSADLPKQRILEATRGAILARGNGGIALLVEQFQSSDKSMFQIALSTAREFPGSEVDKALAAEMARAKPAQAALIVTAMADRPDTVVLPAVLKAAADGDKTVRIAAIAALGRVGDATCLSPLLEIANAADADLNNSAKAALAELAGEKVDAEIRNRLAKAEGKSLIALLELVGRRRIDAQESVFKALDHADPAIRSAALTALGETVQPDNLKVLVALAVAPKHAEDEDVALQALQAAAVRMPDREACSATINEGLAKSNPAKKAVLLPILGAVGGEKALATIGAAAKDSDPNLQDVSTRLLGEWMTADAAPVLLDLVKSAPGEKYQNRSLRGYIRIARQFVLPENERNEMCRKAFAACSQPAEQKMVLDVCKRYPNVETLKLAVHAASIPELKDDATAATLAIVQKIGAKSPEAVELLAKAGLEKVKLEIIKAEYGAGDNQKDVTAQIRKQAGDFPLIGLANPSFNASFGGDPAPGTVKQLKIQYKINDKAGEATFAEDSLIVLPIPK